MVEMLVSLGIITVITAIVLYGQQNFNRSLVLVDTSYTIAFTIRQAQSLGLSSKRFGNIQNAGYGVHFTSTPGTTYTLFADTVPAAPGNSQEGKCAGHTILSGLDSKPGNCVYDSSAENVTVYTLNKGFAVASFCGVDTAGTQRCSGSYLDSLDISFLRPNTQASIIGVRAGAPVELVSATIHVASPDGAQERCVQVTKVGQVAVGNCP